MKIYLLEWLDSDADFVAQREAFYGKRDSKKRHAEIYDESITRMDLTVGSYTESVREVVVRNREELIDLINSLQ